MFSKPMSTQMVVLGHLGFLLYFLMCYIFYQERMLNCDAASYAFNLVNNEEYFIKHGRYMSYFTQSLSMLLIKLNASLATVLKAYSVSASLWYYMFYIIAVHVFKSVRGGMFILLSLILFMRYKFYAGHTEITFAIALSGLVVVWFVQNKIVFPDLAPWKKYTITLILGLGLSVTHPLIIVPLLMSLGYFFLFESEYKDRSFYKHLGIIVLIFCVKWYMVSLDSYEGSKMSSISNWDVFLESQKYYVYIILRKYMFGYVAIPVLVYLCSAAVLLWKKRWKEFIYFLLCTSVLSYLVITAHAYLKTDVYIMIDGYIALFAILATLMLYRAIDLLKLKDMYSEILVGLLVVISFAQIYNCHYFFTQRLDYYRVMLTEQAQEGRSKLFLGREQFHWKKLWYPYQVPLESLIVSTLDEDTPVGTIFVDYHNRGLDSERTQAIYLNFYADRDLNPRYFNLKNVPYETVPDSEIPWKR